MDLGAYLLWKINFSIANFGELMWHSTGDDKQMVRNIDKTRRQGG
jgi:hypothetical protein